MSEQAKHTPGPWRLEAPGHERPVWTIQDSIGMDVAMVESEYDAVLIAAAPDLLAACLGMIHHNNALKAEYRIPGSLENQIESAIRKATSA